MALVESHDCNWEASRCVIRFFLVCVWYDFMAALKMIWKREEGADVDGVWDITGVVTVLVTVEELIRMICLPVKAGMRVVDSE